MRWRDVDINELVRFAKCIAVTRVCVSVCVSSVCMSVRGRMLTLLHGPEFNLGDAP